MPDIPGIVPIERGGGRRAVTTPAKIVQLGRRQLGRIHQFMTLRIRGVVAAGTVAVFTSNTVLSDLNFTVVAKRYRPGGMAFETAFDSEARVGNGVKDARGLRNRFGDESLLAGRGPVRLRGAVPAGVVFQIPLAVDPGNEGSGLTAGAESPL